MITRLGIGIVTRDRRDIVLETVRRVRAHTQHPHTLVVADDGSQDGTPQALRDKHVQVMACRTQGTAWNKNRVLFYLVEIARCDIVILLEDDTAPRIDGWERDWALAAARFGHVGISTSVAPSAILSGSGVATDPFQATDSAAHAAAFSREAILFGGYFDSRFTQPGFENIEHSVRLIRHGYGGHIRTANGAQNAIFLLLQGGVTVFAPDSYISERGLAQNRQLAHAIIREPGYRGPWRDEAGLRQFRAEMASIFPRIARQLIETTASAQIGAGSDGPAQAASG